MLTDFISTTIVAVLFEDGTVEPAFIREEDRETFRNTDSDLHELEQWTDIIDIAVCRGLLVGLKADGVAVAVGCGTEYGQYSINENWNHIKELSSTYWNVYGLREDGTLVREGTEDLFYGTTAPARIPEEGSEHWLGVKKLFAWTGAYGEAVLALREDGTVLYHDGLPVTRPWSGETGEAGDLVELGMSSDALLGLRSDGTVALCFKWEGYDFYDEYVEPTGIRQIAVRDYICVGLTEEGTVVDLLKDTPPELQSWRNISRLDFIENSNVLVGFHDDGSLEIVTDYYYPTIFSSKDDVVLLETAATWQNVDSLVALIEGEAGLEYGLWPKHEPERGIIGVKADGSLITTGISLFL